MSVETETQTASNTADTNPIPPKVIKKPKSRSPLRFIGIASGVIIFLGLLSLGLLATVGSTTSEKPSTPPSTPIAPASNVQPVQIATQHITSLVSDPTDYQTLFAATNKGVFSSTDGGKSWNDISDGLGGATVTTLALDGNDPERPLYAATFGAGFFKSSDAGKTWTNLGLTGRDIATIAANQGHIYLGVRGPFSTLFSSADGGKTFTEPDKNQLPPSIDIRSIAVDPVNSNQVYIGTAYVSNLHFPDLGRVKYSSDGGKTWRDLGQWQNTSNPALLDAHDQVTVLLAVSNSRIYAGDGNTLFRLTPDQTNWQLVTGGLPANGTLDLASDPQLPTVLYAYAVDGFYRSTDGLNWVKISDGNRSPLLPGGEVSLSTPALIAANTHNDAVSVNNLNSTYLYGLGKNGDLVSYENRDFGNNKLAALPGGAPLPDFSAYNGINPADPVAAPTTNDNSRIYFKETGHFISGGFYNYWKQNGGLETFGLPLTEEFGELDPATKVTRSVQYFERAKFEYHADVAVPSQRVQVALLGREATAGKYYAPGRFIATNSTQNFFPLTDHTIRGAFYEFWKNNGGLGRFGYPLSEALQETQSDGRKLTVQYFERAKLESENNGPVRISLLGRQVLVQRGWLKK